MKLGTTPWIVIGTVAGIVLASLIVDRASSTPYPVYGAVVGFIVGLLADRYFSRRKKSRLN